MNLFCIFTQIIPNHGYRKTTYGCLQKPEVGRGCAFCNCGSEPEAKTLRRVLQAPRNGLARRNTRSTCRATSSRCVSRNTRRSFYQNVNNLDLKRGDIVAVEASPGHDIGVVSLTGDLVARQMRRTDSTPTTARIQEDLPQGKTLRHRKSGRRPSRWSTRR